MEKWKIVHATKEFNIHQGTLSRYCATMTDEDLDSDSTPAFKIGYDNSKKIFSSSQEEELGSYIKKSSDIYFGLSPLEVRKLAFSYADHLGLVCQEPYSGSTTSWIECGQCKEWAQEKCVSD
ncbi:hypothetical protein OUZ56_011825 [Daphnia magna]|uniref:Uncharacterized protein n=1 Tax=Daphnia magna TaxID=35525 RepID=A0ABQ9Z189_9CRUS|nr:hypothetical protein OUZ56_011825 [Daphnia magna]